MDHTFLSAFIPILQRGRKSTQQYSSIIEQNKKVINSIEETNEQG